MPWENAWDTWFKQTVWTFWDVCLCNIRTPKRKLNRKAVRRGRRPVAESWASKGWSSFNARHVFYVMLNKTVLTCAGGQVSFIKTWQKLLSTVLVLIRKVHQRLNHAKKVNLIICMLRWKTAIPNVSLLHLVEWYFYKQGMVKKEKPTILGKINLFLFRQKSKGNGHKSIGNILSIVVSIAAFT